MNFIQKSSILKKVLMSQGRPPPGTWRHLKKRVFWYQAKSGERGFISTSVCLLFSRKQVRESNESRRIFCSLTTVVSAMFSGVLPAAGATATVASLPLLVPTGCFLSSGPPPGFDRYLSQLRTGIFFRKKMLLFCKLAIRFLSCSAVNYYTQYLQKRR